MKNKIYYMLLMLIMIFSCINNVFAEENLSVSVSADKTEIVKGEEVSVKVKVTSNSKVLSCKFKIETEGDLELSATTGANGWNVTGQGPDGILTENKLNDNDTMASGRNVLEVKYKVNSDGKITVKTDSCDIDGVEVGADDVSVDVKAIEASDDTTLKSIVVTGGQMEPTFESTKYDNYIVNLDSSKFSLELTANNPEYEDKIVVTDDSGNTLDPANMIFNNNGSGQMLIHITVNNKTKYDLLVTYTQKDLDNSLKSLTINGEQIGLEKGKYVYEIKYSGDEKFELEAILEDSENFEISNEEGSNIDPTATGGVATFNITDFTTVMIVIKPKNSQGGAVGATYTIEVTRENANIKEPDDEDDSKDEGSKDESKEPVGGGNASSNPGTGGISMFLMAIILISSLAGSIYLYQKNMEGYK